ncbi:unnamed protein product, partial [Prorocentrum cordatum]
RALAVGLLAALASLGAAAEEAGRRCVAEKVHEHYDGSDCADSWQCVWDPAGCGGGWENPDLDLGVWDPACACEKDHLGGCRDLYLTTGPLRWRRAALWGPAVALPCAALAGWCAWQRGSFRAGQPLHWWTARYGAGAGLFAVLFVLRPWSEGCPEWNGSTANVFFYLETTVFCALKVVSQVLVAHKLEELRSRRLARAVRALSVSGLLCMSLGAAAASLSWGHSHWEYYGMGMEATGKSPAVIALLLAALCYLLTCICGLWGLLGTVAGAPLCGGGAQWRAACFVRLTAAGLAVSSASAVLTMWYSMASHNVFSNGVSAADAFIDCLMVALFSGLVGPASVRVLARDAFSAINSYTDDQLQAFYEKYLEYLDSAEVRWVRCGYLRDLAASGSVMPRCQEVPDEQVFIGSSGFPLLRNGEKDRFVLSHPWLSKEHPDPTGSKLRLLVHQLDMLHASDAHAIFIDYMSLPQNDKRSPELQRLEREQKTPKPGSHPAVRTQAEEARFKKALSAMELIYSVGKTPVIVLPMGSSVETGREYISRGWCFLEFCLSMSFDNIANADIHYPVRCLMADVKNMKGDTVDGFREAFKSTHFTNKGDADVVLALFEHTLNLASSQ